MIIPVLMYHSVKKESADYLTVAADTFYEQIAFLAENYNIIGMGSAIGALEGKNELPPNPVIISFDDSLKDNLDHALPVLERFQAKAVFYVISGYIGKDNSWDHKAYSISEHMSVADLEVLVQKGFEIGNHSWSHQRLTKLPDERILDEFAGSNRVLEEIIGYEPETFSYPFGGVDERCARLCRSYFKAGFATVRTGCFNWTIDRANIRRIYVSPADQPGDLRYKIACYRMEKQHE